MESQPLQITEQTKELSNRSFDAFDEDIACMLGVEISGKEISARYCTAGELKKQFKKVFALGAVRSEGSINGDFYLIADQEAFFTLAGVLVVQPEKVIVQNRKHGSLDTAKEISDAVGEIGNLMVGSFDRIFREEGTSHGHFVFSNNTISNSWNQAIESVGLKDDSKILEVTHQAVIGTFEPVFYTVMYPEEIFTAKPAEQVGNEAPGAVQNETEQKPEETQVTAVGAAVTLIEEPVVVAKETSEPELHPAETVYDCIQKITQSPATLPGQIIENQVGISEYFTSRTVESVMCKNPVWVTSDETVEQVMAKMQQFCTDYVLVGKKDGLEGIVSKTDVRGAMSPYLSGILTKWKRPLDDATLQIRVKWIMTRPVNTICSTANLCQLFHKLSTMKVRCLPVTDPSGAVTGIISCNELVQMLVKIC
jgi:CBS domain-containing protein